jgi:hypothetical protein
MDTQHGTNTQEGVCAHAVPASQSTGEICSAETIPESVRQHLHALIHTLRDIESTVIVAAGALRDEDGFIGANVAHMLRTQVSNRLSSEIDRATERFAIQLKTYKDEEPWAT